jgi:hypothetical protein
MGHSIPPAIRGHWFPILDWHTTSCKVGRSRRLLAAVPITFDHRDPTPPNMRFEAIGSSGSSCSSTNTTKLVSDGHHSESCLVIACGLEEHATDASDFRHATSKPRGARP